MSLVDSLVSVAAPHDCIVCGSEGNLICVRCAQDNITSVPSRCYKCRKLRNNHRTCNSCRSSSKLLSVYVRTHYDNVAKELVYRLKFARAQAAAGLIADVMLDLLTEIDPDILIVPVPTASVRKRQRGYDQAELIAKSLARKLNMKYQPLLRRDGQQRQLGLNRKQRLEQLQDAFWAREQSVKGLSILLVDDVLTTGGTLEAAASVLRAAGAKRVYAAVFAQA